MGLFGNLEEQMISKMKERVKVTTHIIDTDTDFKLITQTFFDKNLIYTHEQDLIPLLEGIKKRL